MLPYLLHLFLLAEILSSRSQTVRLFTPNTSLSNTLVCISEQFRSSSFIRFSDSLSEGVIIIPILEKQIRHKVWLEGKWLGVEPRPTNSQLGAPVSATWKELFMSRGVVLDNSETWQPLCDLGHVTSTSLGFSCLIHKAQAWFDNQRFLNTGLWYFPDFQKRQYKEVFLQS